MGLTLELLPDSYAVCRLAPDCALPDWACGTHFLSITRTADELSIVCPDARVPAGVKSRSNWRTLKVRGPLDLSQLGILSSLASPLAAGGVSIFAISTYDTDYVLVAAHDLSRATAILVSHGHQVQSSS